MKYDNKESIKILVNLLKENNISNLVISPGGTNIPVIKMVQDDDFFNCYSVVDERSAAYFGIGIYLKTGKPVALICTSAQATRNYIPGLTEAYYKKVPLLAITMEKHPRFKYQGYMQQPDQISLPNDSVKKSFELPYVTDINDIYHCRRLINEAILELSNHGNGPVQLCIPWLDFPIEERFPVNMKITRTKISDIDKLDIKDKKILLIIGEHRPFDDETQKAIDYFCENTNSVIYTNHLSNFKNDYSVDGNFLLSVANEKLFEKIKPDIIITIGGQTGDYPLYLQLSKTKYSNMEHWLVSENGKVMDTYDKLTRIFEGIEYDFFNSFPVNKINHSYINDWKESIKSLSNQIKVPFSSVSIAQFLHDKIPNNSIMQFSILNSLRVWNLFPLDPTIKCYSNVGAFGIDGGMSTLIGQSVISDELCFMIVGDLAFFYDMNSIGIRHIKNNLRIIIINNNGGVEFKLKGSRKEVVDNYIAAANHFKTAKGWAESTGFKYFSAHNMKEFEEVSMQLLDTSDKPIIVEAFVSDLDDRDAYRLIIDSNSDIPLNIKIKKEIKKTIKNHLLKK